MTKRLLKISELYSFSVDETLVWIERLDHPYTDIQGWARLFPKFTIHSQMIGLRFYNGICAFGWGDYGTCWNAYLVDYDPAEGTPVLFCGTVTTLEELASSDDAGWEAEDILKVIENRSV